MPALFDMKAEVNETIVRHRTQVRVRYADTDKMGVVYNGNYFTYFEVGRAELMRHFGSPYSGFEKAGYLLPLVESYAKYIKSSYYDDLLDIEAIMPLELKPLLRFDYRVWRGGELLAEGFTVHSFLNIETGRPVKPPKIFREAINNIKNRL